MQKNRPSFLQLAFALVLLIGITLSMKSIREPDLWWQLRTGEWMLENKAVTTSDVFSFTYDGTPWVNVKWGFEILQTLMSGLGGPEMLPLLQVIITVLLLLVLTGSQKYFGKGMLGETYRPGFGGVLALMAALWIMENRMTGRPEAISHLMTAIYALLFIHHRYRHTAWVFLIIPLQVLWTNLHEAYGVGIIIAGMFTASAWFEYLFLTKKTWFHGPDRNRLPWMISLASLLAFIAIAVNPRGIMMWWHPLEIFSQLGENKYTIELYSFRMREFWNYRSVLALLLAWICYRYLTRLHPGHKNGKISWWKRGINQAGLGYSLFLLATLYLTLSANRNIPFLIIAMVPLMGVSWDTGLDHYARRHPRLRIGVIVLGIGLLFYLAVVSGTYYRIFNPRDRYGLEINVEKTPVGAATFIEAHGIQGRAFTDFLCSSYLLWHLQPDFKTYIDLRDLDIFPPVFFKNNFMLYQYPEQGFPYADQDMQFDYVVLLNEPFLQPLHRYLLTSEDFDLVYGDLLASVYLRKSALTATLIDSLGFRSNSRDVFHPFVARPVSGPARVITRVFNPLHTFRIYKTSDPRARGAYYQYLGYSPVG